MDPVVLSILVAAVGGIAGALARLLLNRRAERVAVRGPARLVLRELEHVEMQLRIALALRVWPWSTDRPLSVPTWERESTSLASALNAHDVLAVHAAMSLIQTANARRKSADEERQRLPDESPSTPMSDRARIELRIAAEEVRTARTAVLSAAEGLGGVLQPTSVARQAFECQCGHSFSEHKSLIGRRWVRFPEAGISHAEIGMRCGICKCPRYVADDSARIAKRLLRRARILRAAGGKSDPILRLAG